MTSRPAIITLAALLTSGALAQTSGTASPRRSTTTARRTPVATKSTSAARSTSAAAANPADNPPGVPVITGTPKPLYALRYVDTVIGTGDLAQPGKYYTVRYTGWLTNGTKFDSSDDHPGKEPITFPYGAHRVIPGWDTGFEGMHVGGKRRIFIPYQLAYGDSGRPPVIPPKSDLIFDMELVSISDAPPAPPAPPAAPAGDQTSEPTRPAERPTTPADPTKPTSTSPAPSSNPEKPQTPQK